MKVKYSVGTAVIVFWGGRSTMMSPLQAVPGGSSCPSGLEDSHACTSLRLRMLVRLWSAVAKIEI